MIARAGEEMKRVLLSGEFFLQAILKGPKAKTDLVHKGAQVIPDCSDKDGDLRWTGNLSPSDDCRSAFGDLNVSRQAQNSRAKMPR